MHARSLFSICWVVSEVLSECEFNFSIFFPSSVYLIRNAYCHLKLCVGLFATWLFFSLTLKIMEEIEAMESLGYNKLEVTRLVTHASFVNFPDLVNIATFLHQTKVVSYFAGIRHSSCYLQ